MNSTSTCTQRPCYSLAMMEWALQQNFRAMPKPLRWLTALGLSVALLLVATVIPGSHVRFLDQTIGGTISIREWWLSGAGWVVLFTYGLMPASAVLMLRRSRHARALYLTGWLAANACGPLVAWLIGTSVEPVFLALGFLTLALVALYLGRSRAVRAYFQVETHPG